MAIEEVVNFFVQSTISVSGAFLAAYLAGKRFRDEKWWERKATAYSELVGALHQMKWPSSEHMDAKLENRKISDIEAGMHWEQFKEARREVWRIADASFFLVSPKVLKAVQKMEDDLSKATNSRTWFEQLDEQYAAIQMCLDTVKTLGREELGIKYD